MASFGHEFLAEQSLRSLGLGGLGDGVLVHPTAIIIGLENLIIGDHSRIDPYTVIVANDRVSIGRNVHIGAGCYIAGGGTVALDDFSGLSQGVRIYSVSDDYSGRTMTNPTLPGPFTGAMKAPVRVGRHVIIGSGSVVLPGAIIGDGCAIGALSLVNRPLEAWRMYAGSPVRDIGARRDDLLKLEQDLIAGEAASGVQTRGELSDRSR